MRLIIKTKLKIVKWLAVIVVTSVATGFAVFADAEPLHEITPVPTFQDVRDSLATEDVSVEKTPCPDFADPVRVKVGDMEFHIPSKYHPKLSNNYPDKNEYKESCKCFDGPKDQSGAPIPRKGYCQGKNELSFKVDNVFIQSEYFAEESKRQGNFPKWLGDIDIRLHAGYSDASKMYCDNIAIKNLTAWQLYKENSDFQEAFDKTSLDEVNGRIYYASNNPRFFGFPIFIECGRKQDESWHPTPLFDGTYSKVLGRLCNAIIPVNSSVQTRVRFHDRLFHPSKWSEGFKYIENFIREKSINKLPDNTYIPCNQLPVEEK